MSMHNAQVKRYCSQTNQLVLMFYRLLCILTDHRPLYLEPICIILKLTMLIITICLNHFSNYTHYYGFCESK
jgi:hypothetical protein